MLKPTINPGVVADFAAAFGRLCVETLHNLDWHDFLEQPPSGGCVLKRHVYGLIFSIGQPPSGGCVLKP